MPQFGSRRWREYHFSVHSKFTFVVPDVLKQAGAAGHLLSVYLVLQHVLQHSVSAVLPVNLVQCCLFAPATAEKAAACLTGRM